MNAVIAHRVLDVHDHSQPNALQRQNSVHFDGSAGRSVAVKAMNAKYGSDGCCRTVAIGALAFVVGCGAIVAIALFAKMGAASSIMPLNQTVS